jgi:ABC-2 type transport system permease protein
MTVLRGLWRLTWLEIKIFLREPLGAIGSIVFPVVMYVVIGRVVGRGVPSDPIARDFILVLPVLIAVMIQLNAVISLIAIISIYREGAFSSGCARRRCGRGRSSARTSSRSWCSRRSRSR